MATTETGSRTLVLSRLAGIQSLDDVLPARPSASCCATSAPAHVLVPATARGPWVAREFVRSRLCPVHARDVEVEASMLVSELAKDAVRDGRAPVSVSVECWGYVVAVGLTARAGNVHVASDAAARKLTALLLDRLTAGWGIESLDDSRFLWGLIPTGRS